MNRSKNDKPFVDAMNKIFSEIIPFHKLLGIKVDSITDEQVKLSVQMRKDLMGHARRGMLHGGVISTLIDVAGGLAACMSVHQQSPEESLDVRLAKCTKVTTIDFRVDFLRPGTGKKFVATGYVLRSGKKIAVTRIELHNEEHQLIAVGTGSYTVA